MVVMVVVSPVSLFSWTLPLADTNTIVTTTSVSSPRLLSNLARLRFTKLPAVEVAVALLVSERVDCPHAEPKRQSEAREPRKTLTAGCGMVEQELCKATVGSRSCK